MNLYELLLAALGPSGIVAVVLLMWKNSEQKVNRGLRAELAEVRAELAAKNGDLVESLTARLDEQKDALLALAENTRMADGLDRSIELQQETATAVDDLRASVDRNTHRVSAVEVRVKELPRGR